MKLNLSFNEALAKASPILREKMLQSRDLLLKAEKLSLLYDPRGGVFPGF